MNVQFGIYATVGLRDGTVAGRLHDERYGTYEEAVAASHEKRSRSVSLLAVPVVEYGGSTYHDGEASTLFSLVYVIRVSRGNMLISLTKHPSFKLAYTRVEAIRRLIQSKDLSFSIAVGLMDPGGLRDRPRAVASGMVWQHRGADDGVLYAVEAGSPSPSDDTHQDGEDEVFDPVPRPKIARRGSSGRAIRVRKDAAPIRPARKVKK